MSGFDGARINRLDGDTSLWWRDNNDDYLSDAPTLAARAQHLVRNDPVIAALVNARMRVVHGAEGMKFRSLFQEDDEADTSPEEQAVRKQIEAWLEHASDGTAMDADGIRTRLQLEEELDEIAIVEGDAFAIRCYFPGRTGTMSGTCWRIIRPSRVGSPPRSDAEICNGIEIGPHGPEALWIMPANRYGSQRRAASTEYQRIPWFSDDGTPNVIHRLGKRLAGAHRGVSELAPFLVTARQVKELLEAYVVAKRIQACHPIFVQVDNPVEAAKGDRNGVVMGPNTRIEPGKIYYISRNSSVNFSSVSFDGADMREFLETIYRNQFAAWGMPLTAVLASMSGGSNQAARSDWMAYYQQGAKWQSAHISEASEKLDECAIREGVALGEIKSYAPISRLMKGRYVRPAKPMPDPLKEAQTVAQWKELGRDLTGLFSESAGIDYGDSIKQRAKDDAQAEAQDVGDSAEEVADPEDAADTEDAPPANDQQQADQNQQQEAKP